MKIKIGSANAALEELVSQSEQLVAELSTSDSKDNNQYELEKRLRELNDWLHYNISPSSKSHEIKNDSNDDRDDGKFFYFFIFLLFFFLINFYCCQNFFFRFSICRFILFYFIISIEGFLIFVFYHYHPCLY